MLEKRGQVTIFIIIAIVLVAGIVLFFALGGQISIGGVSAEFKPVEEYFQSCIKDYSTAGISIMEESGGYIYQPDFEPGSAYSPSSNKLDFLGSGVPYWYYISGNNIVKEQAPSKADMENQLEKYLENNLACDFSSFTARGFDVNLEEIKATVKILDNKVQITIDADLQASLEDKSVKISSHKQDVNSKLGKFYNIALDIYNSEKQEAFLEKYALDVLYTYAPVNDVELSCSPKVWVLDNVKNEIKQGLEANLLMLKVQGNYYSKADKYFVSDIKADEAVQFLYSRSWPTKIETQDDNGVLVASPVGNQPGLGILGFCYVAYHFVYDINFPVLIQIYDEKEIFRFPVVVLIQGNKERQALEGSYVGEPVSEICKYKNADIGVYTYNTNLEPVEADISFKCFNEICSIGKTEMQGSEAVLEGKFPRCVNGFVIAEAKGYEIKKQILSSNEETSSSIILDRLYDVNVEFNLDGKNSNDLAVVYFESGTGSATLAWPEMKKIQLAEGSHNVTVFVYRNSSILIPASKTKKCVNTPKPGLLGIFGGTTEKCFDLEIPSQTLDNVIIGGGKSEQYITETELQKGRVSINAESLKVPGSLEEVQKNYELLEGKTVYLDFK